jgi:hypothetical protein
MARNDDDERTRETATDYRLFTTFTLESTLVSLRSAMIVHGPTDTMRGIQSCIERELARRKDAGNG